MSKKYGLHHGAPFLLFIWALYILHPAPAMIISLLGIGWFGGKEYQEFLQRGSMEWFDVITPVIFGAVSFGLMVYLNV